MHKKDNVTELEKLLYNKHLAVSRSLKNKPFRIKKSFEDLLNTDKHKHLKRISILFSKHPEIDPQLFFESPYRLYPDVEYFGLDYFSTMRAVKSYTTYRKQIFLQDPDSQVESIKQSLKFIVNFCIQKNIHFHQYPYYKESDFFVWINHYKQNKINVYSVMEFPDIYSSLMSLAEDVRKFFVGEFVDNFKNLYIKYNNSTQLKHYIRKAIPVLSNFVEKQLNQTKTNIQ